MNSLSWLIYFASVSNSAGAFFAVLAIIGAVTMLLGFILSILWTGGTYSSARDIEAYQALNKRGKSMLPIGTSMLIICGTISVFLPTASTVYAVAASQVGERIISDEAMRGIASDSSKALQAWIKKQIEPEAKK